MYVMQLRPNAEWRGPAAQSRSLSDQRSSAKPHLVNMSTSWPPISRCSLFPTSLYLRLPTILYRRRQFSKGACIPVAARLEICVALCDAHRFMGI
ncbi:hypothetical protein CEP54_016228 [Fusarium duplospermum]|uniref:Uncharacterized protein n=1 Tax=Fusarium duplospermum TaxID=1325734 RepID=A0A428NGJ6_9HYPO|nr:hypothetical protein CEP54_016228 [Fusarium duplospermum]